MVNTINNGEALVEIEFSIGTKQYKVIRGIKPNIFEIYEDDQLINQDASSIDYQKILERNIMILPLIGVICILAVFIVFSAAGRSDKANRVIWPFALCFISFLVFLGFLAS